MSTKQIQHEIFFKEPRYQQKICHTQNRNVENTTQDKKNTQTHNKTVNRIHA